jgi:hypothetical protein
MDEESPEEPIEARPSRRHDGDFAASADRKTAAV